MTGDNPLPESVMIKLYDAIWRRQATITKLSLLLKSQIYAHTSENKNKQQQ